MATTDKRPKQNVNADIGVFNIFLAARIFFELHLTVGAWFAIGFIQPSKALTFDGFDRDVICWAAPELGNTRFYFSYGWPAMEIINVVDVSLRACTSYECLVASYQSDIVVTTT